MMNIDFAAKVIGYIIIISSSFMLLCFLVYYIYEKIVFKVINFFRFHKYLIEYVVNRREIKDYLKKNK